MNVNYQTLASIIRLAVGLVVAMAAAFGINLDSELAYNVAIAAAALAVLVYLWWWKDNPITKAAQKAHEIFAMMKSDKGDWKTIVIEKQPEEIAAGAVYPDDGKDEEDAVADEEYQTW